MIIVSREETTIDYPGKFGQILFTPGCNFRCGFCHNPELINEKKEGLNLSLLMKDLENWSRAGWYQAITLSGGEPTLQKDLPEFVRNLKSLGLSIKIDTNGTNPDMLQQILEEGNVDYIAMDIKTTPEKYRAVVKRDVKIEDIEKSIEIVKKFSFSEFRTTVLPSMKKEDIEKMGSWISKNGKPKLWTLQQFNPERTLSPEYGKLLPKTKEEIENLAEIAKKYADDVRVLG